MFRVLGRRFTARRLSPGVERRRFAGVATRTPQESYVEKLLPFSKDESLQNAYVNVFGLAGAVSYKHVLGETSNVTRDLAELTAEDGGLNHMKLPVVIVTAGVDTIQMFEKLNRTEDLLMHGRVVATGKSSMEVFLEVDAMKSSGKRVRVAEANFTMVARGDDNRAFSVPSVNPTSDDERKLNSDAVLNRERRKRRSIESLNIKAPTADEVRLIHSLFMHRKNQRLQPTQSPQQANNINLTYADMQSTGYQSVIVMQPQKKNIHNKIFGGYLMRLAFEQAWATAWLFTGQQPHFRAVDEINFIAPVEIGTICKFISMVTYTTLSKGTEPSATVVEVICSVCDPPTGIERITNTFYFTFSFGNQPIKMVEPLLYDDAVKYLDGKRRYEEQLIAELEDRAKFKTVSF